ncbi:TetR/AcrR family transcriptional regulator [Christensenellaceae bacterium OttesenSCG-928-M15]|nr:TetR/AcrR family transcriptional regulator [Christensenellaceae bacterium OttesenSCG-928-M15]
MAEKKDLRIKKTERALTHAMLDLLEKQSFAKITVNDLCTEAMVSRSAFYAHFEDKYALLHFCVDVLKRRLFDEEEPVTLYERLIHVLNNIKSNVKIFKNLVMAELDVELMEMMRKSFQADFEFFLEKKQIAAQDLPGPSDVVAAYYVSGITSAIMLWVAKNMPYTVDEMASTLLKLLPAGPHGAACPV